MVSGISPFTWTFNGGAGTDTSLSFGDNIITATTDSLSLTGDLTVTGNDITFGNSEKISNTTDGVVAFTNGSANLFRINDKGAYGTVQFTTPGSLGGTCAGGICS